MKDLHTHKDHKHKSVYKFTPEDLEQITYVEQWNLENPNGSIIFWAMMVALALVGVGFTTMAIRSCEMDPLPTAVKKSTNCVGCHNQPKVPRTYKEYNAAQKAKRMKVRGPDLAELVKP